MPNYGKIAALGKSVCAKLWMLQWVKGGSMHPLFTWAPRSPIYHQRWPFHIW